MDLYGHSHIQALKAIYPEYPWRAWKFLQVSKPLIFNVKVPKGFWEKEENIKEVLETLAKGNFSSLLLTD